MKNTDTFSGVTGVGVSVQNYEKRPSAKQCTGSLAIYNQHKATAQKGVNQGGKRGIKSAGGQGAEHGAGKGGNKSDRTGQRLVSPKPLSGIESQPCSERARKQKKY